MLRAKPALIELAETIYEAKIIRETEAQKKICDVRNQEKRVVWENPVQKTREKGIFINSFLGTRLMQKSAVILKVRSVSVRGGGGERQVQHKRPKLDLHGVSTKDLMTILQDIFVTTRIIAFERCKFI